MHVRCQVETTEHTLREVVAVQEVGEFLREGIDHETEHAAIGERGVAKGCELLAQAADIRHKLFGREVISGLGNLDIAAFNAATGGVALFVAYEIIAAWGDVGRVLVDASNLECLMVAPCTMARGSHQQNRLIGADGIQAICQRMIVGKDCVREALTEISLAIGVGLDILTDHVKDFLLRCAPSKLCARSKCRSHKRMNMAVDKAGQKHLTLKVFDLGCVVGKLERLFV